MPGHPNARPAEYQVTRMHAHPSARPPECTPTRLTRVPGHPNARPFECTPTRMHAHTNARPRECQVTLTHTHPNGYPWQAWVSVERAQRACPRKDAELPFHDVTRAVAPVDAQPARLFIGRQRHKMHPSPMCLTDVSSLDTDGLMKTKVRRWATAGNCR